MPEDKNEQEPAMAGLAKILVEQVERANEQWQKVIEMGKTVEEIAKTLPRIAHQVNMAKGGMVTHGANLSDFAHVDTAIANIDTLVAGYATAIQACQSTFDKLMKSSGDIPKELAKSMDAIYENISSLLQSGAEPEAAWNKGKAAFMPIYRRAKLELVANASKFSSPQ